MRQIDTSLALPRTSVAYLDGLLGHSYPVLDHGFVRVIDYMGDDAAIVQAARISYGEGTKSVSDDQGLINYLMRHRHSTPFEMCEIKLHVKLPVFVARQWIRHRTASVNEYSARYSILDKEFYVPNSDVIAHQSKVNAQGRGELMSPAQSMEILEWMVRHNDYAYQGYSEFVTPEDKGGYDLARELARMNLPMNIYTQWYWKTDLHNLFHFLRLRNDPHAQYEIRAYAELIETHVASWVPLAYSAYVRYQKQSVTFSLNEAKGLALLLDTEQGQAVLGALKNFPPTELNDLMSKGEWREFLAKLDALAALNAQD